MLKEGDLSAMLIRVRPTSHRCKFCLLVLLVKKKLIPLIGGFFWIDLFLKKAHESFMEKHQRGF